MTSLSPRILVVDDESTIRNVYFRWFTQRGFDVHTAPDGIVAVQQCRIDRYDIIIMDLKMPGMDGFAAIEAIRELHPDTPIIVVSGCSPDDTVVLTGSNLLALTKPLSLLDLERYVRMLLPQEL